MKEKNLWQYFVECVTKNYFNFKGRARRKEYWSFVLFSLIATFLSCLLLGFVLYIPWVAVTVRRLQDRNMNGWWAIIPCLFNPFILAVLNAMEKAHNISLTSLSVVFFLSIVTSLAGIFFFVNYCMEGTKGKNKYGEDPKEELITKE